MAAPVATEDVDRLLRMLCGYALQAGMISEQRLRDGVSDEAKFDWERALDVFDGVYHQLGQLINWGDGAPAVLKNKQGERP